MIVKFNIQLDQNESDVVTQITESFESDEGCGIIQEKRRGERYCSTQLTSRFNKVLESPYVTISRTKCLPTKERKTERERKRARLSSLHP